MGHLRGDLRGEPVISGAQLHTFADLPTGVHQILGRGRGKTRPPCRPVTATASSSSSSFSAVGGAAMTDTTPKASSGGWRERVAPVERDTAAAQATCDRLAGIYDLVEAPFERRARAVGLRLLAARSGERVLEVGPGTAHTLVALLARSARAGASSVSTSPTGRRLWRGSTCGGTCPGCWTAGRSRSPTCSPPPAGRSHTGAPPVHRGPARRGGARHRHR